MDSPGPSNPVRDALTMKVKCRPDDFQVEEITDVTPTRTGRFTFYRLVKQGLGTPEAIEAVRRRWNLSAGQFSYGGMKPGKSQLLDLDDHLMQVLRAFRRRLGLRPLRGIPLRRGWLASRTQVIT